MSRLQSLGEPVGKTGEAIRANIRRAVIVNGIGNARSGVRRSRRTIESSKIENGVLWEFDERFTEREQVSGTNGGSWRGTRIFRLEGSHGQARPPARKLDDDGLEVHAEQEASNRSSEPPKAIRRNTGARREGDQGTTDPTTCES